MYRKYRRFSGQGPVVIVQLRRFANAIPRTRYFSIVRKKTQPRGCRGRTDGRNASMPRKNAVRITRMPYAACLLVLHIIVRFLIPSRRALPLHPHLYRERARVSSHNLQFNAL